MMQKKVYFYIAVFVVVSLLSMVFLIFKASNSRLGLSYNTYSVTGFFNHVGNLKKLAPVKVSGVIVGEVTDIELDTDRWLAKVSLSLKKDYQFLDNSSLSILTTGLLGEQYVEISPGYELTGEESLLQDDDVIYDTKGAIILENLISQYLFNSQS